jgi:nucleotide-binding universal stress UspA family protein
MRLEKILVATDFSPAAQPVYRWAAALALRFGSRVTLVNVDETSQFEWPARTLQSSVRLKQLLRDLSQQRQDRLDQDRDRLEKMGLQATVQAVVGRASDSILDHVETQGADLVVIGRRGTRKVERSGLGSTTRRVLRRARVPTLVVPRVKQIDDEPFTNRRIISATTFSAACIMALDATLELAEALESHVDCVHVIRLPVPFSITPAEWPELISGETMKELEHLHLKDLSEQIGDERAGRCTPYTTLGVSVSESLRDLALETGVDLITLPSHSSARSQPSWFGSTAERVVKLAPVPVLVFPVRYLERRFGLTPSGS